MKRLIFLVMIWLLAFNAHAFSAVTKDGYAACLKKEWLEDVVSFSSSKDRDSFEAYINSKKCIVMGKGLQVTVTERPEMFSRATGFVYKGVKLWTVIDALDY